MAPHAIWEAMCQSSVVSIFCWTVSFTFRWVPVVSQGLRIAAQLRGCRSLNQTRRGRSSLATTWASIALWPCAPSCEEVLATLGGRSPALRERLVCSDCCQWALPGVRMLTTTKRLFGTATGAGLSGGCRGYCSHTASAPLLVQRYWPLPWRYRPLSVASSGCSRMVPQCSRAS